MFSNDSSVYSQLSLHLLHFICFLQSSFEHHVSCQGQLSYPHVGGPRRTPSVFECYRRNGLHCWSRRPEKRPGGNTSLSDELIFRFLPTSQWSVEVLENGNVAIQYPAHLRPSRSLSYEKPAEEGKRIILGPVSDFPSCEWRVEVAPQKPLPIPFLSVWNSDFSFYLLTDYLSELAAFVSLKRISS